MDATTDTRARQARQQLESGLPQGILVEFDSVFPRLTGWGAQKRNKRRLAQLNLLGPVLNKILKRDEKLLFVSEGTVNLWWEVFFMGFWAMLINRTALVVTNNRLLLIHLSNKKPESFVNQVDSVSIKKVTGGLFSLLVYLGSGKISLSGVPPADKKVIRSLFPKKERAEGGLTYLCSGCFAPHQQHVLVCRKCRTQFKSPRIAAIRSLVLPGLGDFYLGHRGMAVLEMIGSVLSWILIFVIVITTIEEGVPIAGVIVAGLILLLANGTDALLTMAQGKKGLISPDGQLGMKTDIGR